MSGGNNKDVQSGKSAKVEHQFVAPVPFITMVVNPSEEKCPATLNLSPSRFGLGNLTEVHKFYIHPVVKLGFRTQMHLNCRYKILDDKRQHIFFAGEFIDTGSKCWRGMQRRCCIYIFSTTGTLLFTFERQRTKCCSNLPPKQEAVSANVYHSQIDFTVSNIMLASGELIGQIRDTSSVFTPILKVDENGCRNIVSLEGRRCGVFPLIWCRNSPFTIYDNHHYNVGSVRNNILPEGVNSKGVKCVEAAFPRHINEITKACILAASFDIKISYFDRACPFESCTHLLLYTWLILFGGLSVFLVLWSSSVIKI